MSSGFKSTENKKTKPQRLGLCVLFIIEILLLAMPYIAMYDDSGVYHSKTILELILGIESNSFTISLEGFLLISETTTLTSIAKAKPRTSE